MWMLSSFWFQILSALFIFTGIYYIYFKLVASKYWKKRNIFQLDPVFLLGNTWKALLNDNISVLHKERYQKWKDKKLIGFWFFTTPGLLVTDLELIKRILIRDFNHFMDRNFNINEDIDPLAGNLIHLTGSKWKNLRTKLTPNFSSGKLKMMFPIMVDCGLQLKKFLEKRIVKEETLEMKEVFERFAIDNISSCAFGIGSNCLNNPDSEFRHYGIKIFQPKAWFAFVYFMNSFFPRLRAFFKIRTIPKDVSNFFINVVRDTVSYRKEKGVTRNDFMDFLIQLMGKVKLDQVDSETRNAFDQDQELNLIQVAAQVFVFFVAGLETTSATLSYAFYELALNPGIQKLLQEEINSALEKTNGEITYEGIMRMEYLDWVIQETLRKYPPVAFISRKCVKEYEIPEMGINLEKEIRVFISILGIHRDPQFFPNPEKFDPKRFSPEEKAKRDRLTFMPFGEGPRNCIGYRFGLLQIKVAIVSVLSKYNLKVSNKTPIPIKFNTGTFILTPMDGVPLKIIRRDY